MPYIGQPPVSGDTTKSFRLLDNLASFTLSFDATSSSVVDTTANTLTFANHRFVTAQRVTYADGGGTAIGGLTDGTAYFIIKVDQNTIQLASSASNANNGTAISLSSGAVGSHTLNLAFDGTNTKFKATYANGTKAKISRAGQLLISINGVLQQAQESSTPTLGFGLDSDSTIVFSQAPVSTDVLFGQILADTITNFDTQDNTLDVFTGDGSTVNFNLSKKPASNNDILVTLDGVVQYPTTTSTSNAYSVTESTLTFTAAPADGVAIQVRHIGFAGATSSAVTGLYGRTGNVTLSSSDDDITVGNVTAGIITATSYGSISGTTASFSGNVSIGGTLTYEDVTNIDAVGLITARSGVKFGASGTTVQGTSTGIGIGTDTPGSILEAHGSGATIHAKTAGASNARVRITAGNAQSSFLEFADTDDSDVGEIVYDHSDNHMHFNTNATERLRIDSSGRFLVGATSTRSNIASVAQDVVVERASIVSQSLVANQNASGGSTLSLCLSRGTSVGSNTVVQSGDAVGQLAFRGNDGTNFLNLGMIRGEVDGTPGTNDMPGRLTFYTTADGASSPTERMRITQSGTIGMGAQEPMTDARLTLAGVDDVALGFKRSGSGKFDNAIHCDGGSMIFKGGTNSNVVSSLNELMRIDSSGRLLLGTTTEGKSGADEFTVATSSNTGITIRSGTSSTGDIMFSDGTSGDDEFRGIVRYDHSNNSMQLWSNSSERMRIDSSGNIGLGGITSPTWASDGGIHLGDDYGIGFGDGGSGRPDFQIITAGDGRLDFRCGFGSDDADISINSSGQFLVGTTSSQESTSRIQNISASDSTVFIGSSNVSASGQAKINLAPSNNVTGAQIICVAEEDFSTGANRTARLEFHTRQNGTLAKSFEITPGGTLQAGDDTNGGPALFVSDPSTANQRGRQVMYAKSGTSGGQEIFQIYNGSTEKLRMRADGNVYNVNNTFSSLSDVKLKENIVDAASQWDDIKGLRVRKYNFKESTGHDTHTQIGLVAQEVETVSPGLVTDLADNDADGNQTDVVTKSVNYSVLYMKAIKALQEAQTRIETLETQQSDLLSRVAALEG